MNIPPKIRIGNYDYDVELVEDLSLNCLGRGALLKQKIKLNSEMSQELREETFFHEIIHQILGQKSFSQEDKNETLIDCLAAGLYQVLKENDFLK